MAETVKDLPAVWENWVQFLNEEDSLEKKMATHSSILAWEIPWTEEPGGLQSTGHKELDSTKQLTFSFLPVAHTYQCVHDQFSSVTQLCPTLCDPMDHSMPGLPVHHQLPEFMQTHVR